MRSKLFVFLVALVVAAQSCCCLSLLGGPQPPYPITPSEETIRQFEERMRSTESNPDGSFTVTITDEEITSLVVLRMLANREEPLPASDIQAYFRNGRVEVYATVQVAKSLTLPALVAFTIDAADGQATVILEDVTLGPFPAPQSVLDSLTDMLNQALEENIQVDGQRVIVSDVQIGEGEMTITGRLSSD